MLNTAKKWIVDTDWLAEHLNAPDLVVFDGSWHLPTANRDPKAEYLAGHIPGALFFDIDDLSDERSQAPAHAPLHRQVRLAHEEDGRRRRHAHRRL